MRGASSIGTTTSSATIIKTYVDKTPGAKEIIEAYFKEIGRPPL